MLSVLTAFDLKREILLVQVISSSHNVIAQGRDAALSRRVPWSAVLANILTGVCLVAGIVGSLCATPSALGCISDSGVCILVDDVDILPVVAICNHNFVAC